MKTLICADSIPWLAEHRDVGAIITSLPDAYEMEMEVDDWSVWFLQAVEQCMLSASPRSAAIFYQTDRKVDGRWESKAFRLFAVAFKVGMHCVWHKIVLRHVAGKRDLFRPGFTHMIAFSREMKSGAPSADVMQGGTRIYGNAMGIKAARIAIDFVRGTAPMIVDPFCGRGTVCAVADALKINSIGLDIDPHQIFRAKNLVVDYDLTGDLVVVQT